MNTLVCPNCGKVHRSQPRNRICRSIWQPVTIDKTQLTFIEPAPAAEMEEFSYPDLAANLRLRRGLAPDPEQKIFPAEDAI